MEATMSEQGGIGKARARIKEQVDKAREQVDKARARERREQDGEPAEGDRFDRFTERARKVLALAQGEARRLNHNYIGTEHLLLGLIREGGGVAAKVLSHLDVELDQARDAVEGVIGRGDRMVVGELDLAPRAKKVIGFAVQEARGLKHRYIGTEHLLLGLIREGDGIAAGVLESLDVDLQQARAEVLNILAGSGHAPHSAEKATKNNVVTCRLGDTDLDALDALVEAGIRTTRSDAASWLIHAGIEANRPLLERVYATVAEIHQLRAEAQDMAQQLVIGEASAPAGESIEEPEAGGEPDVDGEIA